MMFFFLPRWLIRLRGKHLFVVFFYWWKKAKERSCKEVVFFLSFQTSGRLPVFKFSTSDDNFDGFFRKTLKNFEKTFFDFESTTVELFLIANVCCVSKSFLSQRSSVKVKRRRSCSQRRICFNVPANKSSTLSLIAADVSTNLQSCRNAAWRAAGSKKKKGSTKKMIKGKGTNLL